MAKWRNRLPEKGLAGFEDAPRPGGPRRFGHEERLAMAAAATSVRVAADPVATWNHLELAERLAGSAGRRGSRPGS